MQSARNSIYVSNLSPRTTWQNLRYHFESVGRVMWVEVKMDEAKRCVYTYICMCVLCVCIILRVWEESCGWKSRWMKLRGVYTYICMYVLCVYIILRVWEGSCGWKSRWMRLRGERECVCMCVCVNVLVVIYIYIYRNDERK
jgi:hypothetical protein